jgi:hypothetical protein
LILAKNLQAGNFVLIQVEIERIAGIHIDAIHRCIGPRQLSESEAIATVGHVDQRTTGYTKITPTSVCEPLPEILKSWERQWGALSRTAQKEPETPVGPIFTRRHRY